MDAPAPLPHPVPARATTRRWRDRLPPWLSSPAQAAVAAGALAAAVAVAILVLRPQAGPAPQLVLPRASVPVGSAGAASGALDGGGLVGPPTTVTVHVAGAVPHPGVYALPATARVGDALLAAGGALPEADLDRLNLAARLADADRVWVPRAGEPDGAGQAGGGTGGDAGAVGGGAGGPPTTAGLLDLNTATLAQLDALPGVGPATAQAIVSYRQRNGRFRSVTELLDVPGIGPARLEALRPLVKV